MISRTEPKPEKIKIERPLPQTSQHGSQEDQSIASRFNQTKATREPLNRETLIESSEERPQRWTLPRSDSSEQPSKVKDKLPEKNPVLLEKQAQVEEKPVTPVTQTKMLKKRNPAIKNTNPFAMLCSGFESKANIAKDTLNSESINFKALKNKKNYFAQEHNLPFNKKKQKYMTLE